MHPEPVPPAPKPPRRAADPVVAVAGNATMLGIGYMLMRRPILAAVALAGTGFLLWSAAVQTENPLWRILLPVWGLAMILHAWWLTRRARPERLVDLVEPDPARRPRMFAITAASLVLLTLGWFRLDAWWISHDAETAHVAGDCESATAALESFDAVHRVAFGPITLRGEEEREACDLLLTALDQPPTEAADTIGDYMRLLGGWSAEGRGFPDSWLAATANETQLVVCVDAEVGEFQESCSYGNGSFIAAFWAHEFTVKAYELRTGELVSEYTREIGDPCPDYLDGTYTTVYFYRFDDLLGMASEYTDEDFRGMFTELVS